MNHPTTQADPLPPAAAAGPLLKHYILAALACALVALATLPLLHYLDLANIVMLFLLAVFLIALRLGRGPAVLAALLSVALFDFLFVPPRLTFAVADAQYLLTFCIMLTVALVTGQLTAGLRRQAQTAFVQEQRMRALYQMAQMLSAALGLAQVVEVSRAFLRDALHVEVALLLPNEQGELQPYGPHAVWYEPHVVAMTYDGGSGTQSLVEVDDVHYYPLRGATRTRGVLAVTPAAGGRWPMTDQPMLEAVVSLIAIAIERLHYVEAAQQAQVQMAAERLRSSILSALSHDLRTPLTVLVGLADSLALAKAPHTERQKETAEAVRDQALRLCGLVENLLDMARLHAGEVRLRKEWQPLEEVVGASLKLLERSLAQHPIRVSLPADLPALEFDAVLIERVLCNLLENAAKYSPAGQPIEISAHVEGAVVAVSIADRGDGVPAERRARIFDMFVRGTQESPAPGVGLGLAICRAIVEAHGGSISAGEHAGGGAMFTFTLPVGDPPQIDEEALLPETAE